MADAVALQAQLLQGLRQVGGYKRQLVVAEVQHLGRWAEMAPWQPQVLGHLLRQAPNHYSPRPSSLPCPAWSFYPFPSPQK